MKKVSARVVPGAREASSVSHTRKRWPASRAPGTTRARWLLMALSLPGHL